MMDYDLRLIKKRLVSPSSRLAQQSVGGLRVGEHLHETQRRVNDRFGDCGPVDALSNYLSGDVNSCPRIRFLHRDALNSSL